METVSKLKSAPLYFTENTEAIWFKLRQIKRSGWVRWGIPHPETVYDHTLAIRALALEWRQIIMLTDDEFVELLRMIEVHDWAEVITGDIVVLDSEADAVERRKQKGEEELQVMTELCVSLPQGVEALSLFVRYEQVSDQVALYAKELDKLQAVRLAAEYEQRYKKPGLTAEFLEYARNKISVPMLVTELEKIAAISSGE